MAKGKLSLASIVLVLGIAAASGASAAGITTPGGFSPSDENVVAARFCPVNIRCIKGTVPKCHFNPYRHKCVCRCVKSVRID